MTASYWLNRARPCVFKNELPHLSTPVGFPRLCGTERTAPNSDASEFAAVPAALRDVPQWVCWIFGMRDGKQTKIPINPATGAPASVSDSSTWGTFDQAVTGCRTRPGLAGVGFVFTTEDEFCGVDLDECIVDGVVVPTAQEIVDQFNTYTEVSPSGVGLKIFLRGKRPATAKNRSSAVAGFDHLEVYDGGRFFTVTGRSLSRALHDIENRQPELNAFCERFWPTTAKKRAGSNGTRPIQRPVSGTSLAPDMAERERRCLKYIEKCPDAISGDGGHDKTLRIACECFRFDLDESAARRVMQFFNDSKTAGEPWSEHEITHKLESARKIVQDAGDVGCRLRSAPPKEPNVDSPDIAALPSDIGNAKRLVNRFGDRIRFCYGINKWLIWDGRRWKPDDRGMIVKFCKKTALAILDEAKRVSGQGQEALLKWAMTSQKRERLTAMAVLAQPDVAVGPDELDSDPYAFNCLSGTLDLRTGEMGPHRQDDLITKLAPVEYEATAKCPRFERFLIEIFGDQPQLIAFVQRWHGHCLTADVREQYLVIYHGEGNNGKNVLLDTSCGIMGDYACEAPPELLTVRRNPEHPTEIADLLGRRLVIASETEKDTELRLQLVKRLTGNERLKGRFMRRDYFEFTRTHKLILVTNNKPVIREDTEAVWRRIRLVPFDIVIPKHKRDTGLLRKLRCEWPGILAWIVRGCVAWFNDGLPEVEVVVEATDDYRNTSNSFDAFADLCCVFGPDCHCATTALGKAYTAWCLANKRTPLQGKALGKALRDRHCDDGRINGNRCWIGIGVHEPV